MYGTGRLSARSLRKFGLVAVLVVGACRGGGSSDAVTVLAASSLRDPVSAVASAYEATDEGARVDLAFGPSSRLVAQVEAGAPAHVVLTADEATARRLPVPSTPFARTGLAVVVAPGNPGGVHSVADLARVRTVLAASGVPLGTYSAEVLRKAGVLVTPLSYEPDARAVVTKVAQGEADAALAYRFDARGLETVALPAEVDVEVTYHAAVLDRRGQAFVAFLLSDEGQRLLARAGLERP